MIRHKDIWSRYLNKKTLPIAPASTNSSPGEGAGDSFSAVAGFTPAPDPSTQSLDELINAEQSLHTIKEEGFLDHTYERHSLRIIEAGDKYDQFITKEYLSASQSFEKEYKLLKQAKGEASAKEARKRTRELAQKISYNKTVGEQRGLDHLLAKNKTYNKFLEENAQVQEVEKKMEEVLRDYNTIKNDSVGRKELQQIKKNIKGTTFRKGLLGEAKKADYIEGVSYLNSLLRDIDAVLSHPPTQEGETYSSKTKDLLHLEKKKTEYEKLSGQMNDINTGIHEQLTQLQKELEYHKNKAPEIKIVKEPYVVEKVVEKIIEKNVPVERIVEKAVPIEKIIEREVPVERIVEKKVYLMPEREVNYEDAPFSLSLTAKALDTPFQCSYINSLIANPNGRSWEQRLSEFKEEIEKFEFKTEHERDYLSQICEAFEQSIHNPSNNMPLQTLQETYEATKMKLCA